MQYSYNTIFVVNQRIDSTFVVNTRIAINNTLTMSYVHDTPCSNALTKTYCPAIFRPHLLPTPTLHNLRLFLLQGRWATPTSSTLLVADWIVSNHIASIQPIYTHICLAVKSVCYDSLGKIPFPLTFLNELNNVFELSNYCCHCDYLKTS
jgi:hypothetical protein